MRPQPELVKLRYFVGLSMPEAAAALGSAATIRRAALDLCPSLAARRDEVAGGDVAAAS